MKLCRIGLLGDEKAFEINGKMQKVDGFARVSRAIFMGSEPK